MFLRILFAQAMPCGASSEGLEWSLPRVLMVALLSFAVAGCATAPSQEMSDARQALRAAVAAGADQYVAADVGRARSFLEGAEKALALNHYDRARDGAVAAKRAALWARKVAVGIDDAEQALTRARAAGLDIGAAESALFGAKQAASAGQSSVALERAETSRKLSESALGS
jgi:hypothetical protein